MDLLSDDELLSGGKKERKSVMLHAKVIAHLEAIAEQKDLSFGSVVDRILAQWISEKLKIGAIRPPEKLLKKITNAPKGKKLF